MLLLSSALFTTARFPLAVSARLPNPTTTTRLLLFAGLPSSSPLRAFCPRARPSPATCAAFSSTMAAADNPLLVADFDFPPFDRVEPSHVRPGIRELLTRLEGELEELEKGVDPTWGKLVEPLERITDRLEVIWGMVDHLKAVKDSADLRAAVEEVQPDKVKFQLRLGQSKPIYEAFKAIRNSSDWDSLSDARKRIVEAQIKESVLSGVALEDEQREKFNQIEQELEKLTQKFSENVLDATKKFEKLITDKKEIEGLPATALGLAAQTAVSKGHENATAENGPWVITLDAPSYIPVMQHAQNRALREEVYRAYLTRASSGELDNTNIISQILKLRLEKAKLLGYKNYAEVSMAQKMATVERVEELLEKLRAASWGHAVKDMEDLKIFLKDSGSPEANDLTHWDLTFWSERLRESKYDINEEELRPYFALPKVMDGLFTLAHKLFGVTVEPADGLAPVWHSDVKFYCVKDSSNSPVAYFYLILIQDHLKSGGAWMNVTPPVGEKPSLMTFREVETVFHEFGHALQHMLTKQDEGFVAGIRGVEWDAVELPSQFMENWCYHKNTLLSIAKHYETGETLPEEIYAKLVAAKNFRAGTFSWAPGGYAAGYYSYKWAEVLSADAFSAFEDAGLDNEKAIEETGRRFRDTVLALGGGKSPLEVFVSFRGREPSPEPLLRHNGLLPVAA
ncbi:unnamed protein product [Miscanthus lutarioriparius]|uniref:oligopeptidase A n=1 Tax=Miscanthus lutarioriparius TaxID=422564 RepID=A0A811PVI8_9POAL|nr:unnamed protein product [Miscanthus lutarioriparius]